MAYPQAVHTTTRGTIYSYIHVAPKNFNSLYILFLHGFPSTSYAWRHQISFFTSSGHGIIAPDLLGFGQSSKPSGLEMYKGKDMATDITEILVSVGCGRVVGVAHDWGCFLLSRLANYYPEQFSAYAFIDHGYSAPGKSLTFDAMQHVNSVFQDRFGFSIFGYFLFFNEKDAADLSDKHSESIEALFFTSDQDIGKRYKGAMGGIRTWLTKGKTVELPEYLTSEDRQHYHTTFSVENGGYSPAINWYRACLRNINEADEQNIPTRAYDLTHPTLLIASTNFITAAIDFPKQMRSHVPNLRVENVVGGHWLQLERPDEVNKILKGFVTEIQQN